MISLSFCPTPTILPFATLLKYQVSPVSIHFVPCSRVVHQLTVSSQNVHFTDDWKQWQCFTPSKWWAPLWLGELGFFLWFRSPSLLESMNHIQRFPKSRLYIGGKSPYLSGAQARPYRPRKSLDTRSWAQPWVWIWEEAEFSGCRENHSQLCPLFSSSWHGISSGRSPIYNMPRASHIRGPPSALKCELFSLLLCSL